jgi:hypothetical protein
MTRLAEKGLDADALACGVAHGGQKGGDFEVDREDPVIPPGPAALAAGDAPPTPPVPLQNLELPAAKAVEPDPATISAAPVITVGSPAEMAHAGGTPEIRVLRRRRIGRRGTRTVMTRPILRPRPKRRLDVGGTRAGGVPRRKRRRRCPARPRNP